AQERQRTAPSARRDVEVLQHAELLEHARRLERAPDTGPRDAVRLPAEQVDPAELHRSRRPGETGDRVHDRRLARTVGPDEEPEVARGDGEVDALDGDEPVELDAQPAHLEVVVPEARVVDAQDGLRGLEVEPVARDAGLE